MNTQTIFDALTGETVTVMIVDEFVIEPEVPTNVDN